MQMLRRLPRDIPLFGALLLGLSFTAFGYASMSTESALGRPSSTASLGVLFVAIWGALAAAVGLVLGFIVRAAWRRTRRSTGPEPRTWALLTILGVAVIGSAGAGALDVIQYEKEARPRVRLDSGLLLREFRSDSANPVRASIVLYDAEHTSGAVTWGGNRSAVQFGNDRVVVRDTVTGRHVDFGISTLDYVTRVDAVPVSTTHGRTLLAVVMSGRATGRLAIVAVIDENYTVVFEEQVRRCWALGDTPLEVRVRPAAADEYIVVGPRCAESLVLRRKDAA